MKEIAECVWTKYETGNATRDQTEEVQVEVAGGVAVAAVVAMKVVGGAGIPVMAV